MIEPSPAPAEMAMDLRNVEKRYGRRVHALKGVSLSVRRGEIFGLLGPNGAGKSTLVKILMTVVRPTRAEGHVLGFAVGSKQALRRVGYLPENHRFPRYLTGRQTIDFFSSLSGASRAFRRTKVPELLEVVGMTAWADRRIGTYSKGMMQRIGIAQALAADPDLVLLDEPTDGVDPVGRRDIRDVLVRLRDEGRTVFINSHLLSELELICDRVAIMVGGQVARSGTLDELALSRRAYEIETDRDPSAALRAAGWDGRMLPTGAPAELTGTVLRCPEPDPAKLAPVLSAILAAGLTLRRFEPVQPSLEELFMEAVSEVTGSDKYAAGARLTPAKAGAA